jgi:serine/threonine-protein kinase Psk1
MIAKASPALQTVRGFPGTPVTSGDEDSDYGPMSTKGSMRRGRKKPVIIDDVVSANCSPLLKPAPSPSVSSIGLLRQQFEPLSLDSAASSRAVSMTRGDSSQRRSPRGLNAQSRWAGTVTSTETSRERNASGSGSGDETSASDVTTSYEIPLESDFVSDSVLVNHERETPLFEDAIKVPMPALNRKMTADDFEPLRCLGKGAYGTVLLVKQRKTGRLYAQKQFKKASLVVQKKLIQQTKTERQILETVNRHPFVVKLYYAFQDQEKLYLILEYGQGGELFHHLASSRIFPEATAAFYLAEMVLALSHLHDTVGVVYRDLKPENILLDAEGHLLLTDFGLSKVAVDQEQCNSFLGTTEYMAPEVIEGQPYGKAVDWWSFGALAVDFLTGSPPFRGANRAAIQRNICKQELNLPYYVTPDARSLITRLLQKKPRKRLGSNMPRDLDVIKRHRFFRKIDWRALAAREVEPPIQPLITDPELAENFDPEFTELSLSPVVGRDEKEDLWGAGAAGAGNGIGSYKEDPFGGFSFVASSSLLESGFLSTTFAEQRIST